MTALFLCSLACGGDSGAQAPDGIPDPAATPHAAFTMEARILGPVAQDDAGDMLITIRETAGVDATLHFMRLTCTNGATQEWGAESFMQEWGSNGIPASSQVQIQRRYNCPNSARPHLLIAQLTDRNGHDHTVETAPYHPDWP
jgi:hypothetical protein